MEDDTKTAIMLINFVRKFGGARLSILMALSDEPEKQFSTKEVLDITGLPAHHIFNPRNVPKLVKWKMIEVTDLQTGRGHHRKTLRYQITQTALEIVNQFKRNIK